MHLRRFLTKPAASISVALLLVSTGAGQTQAMMDTADSANNPPLNFTTFATFDRDDGELPVASLIQGTDGNFYSTTGLGGTNGDGNVFGVTPGGTLTSLHSFDATDGGAPQAALVQAKNGNFYGTTGGGGAYSNCVSGGCGTVFKIDQQGTLAVLYSFCAQTKCSDGSFPAGALVQATNGSLYGTTRDGGAYGAGTVFKITYEGTLTTLYSFCAQTNCSDGQDPSSALVQALDGTLYGTTGTGAGPNPGTIFKITPEGALTTLYTFCSQPGCADGNDPRAGLIQATDGNFYGTTVGGGINGGGTVFKITRDGTLATLYSFCSQAGCADGNQPIGVLLQATDGNLYGTTFEGGDPKCLPSYGCGTVFRITPQGTLTTLHKFYSSSDGINPYGGLMQATNGELYGTTQIGGVNDNGTIFRLAVGLGPFVETQTASGAVGTPVVILGTNLTGATSVTFNGTTATFTVVSRSEIKTTVPNGATTGTVQVITSSGVPLSSNVPFRITP
jgi:uncharacterized repeat protein (TIGR03803 family)